MFSLIFLTLVSSALATAITKPAAPLSAEAVPLVEILPSWNRPDALVKKIRYGPFRLPAATVKNGEIIASDMRQIVPFAQKPCEGECTIQMMKAGMDFLNGTEITDPRTYLHHAAILNSGPGVTDGGCNKPGIDMFFSSGNEKSFVIYTDPEAKLDAGYWINPGNIFIMQTEVQNQEPVDKDIYVTFSFQIVENRKPALHSKVVWISADLLPCDYVPPPGTKAPELTEDAGMITPPNDRAFNMTSIDWVSPYDGEILACGGHMHSGGVWTKVYQNGNMFCDSVATYATADGGMGGHHMRTVAKRDMGPQGAGEYLEKMSGCTMPGSLKKGDKLRMTAHYDFTQHPGMKNADGSLAGIMALATCFIAAKP